MDSGSRLDIVGLGDSNVDLTIEVNHIAGRDEKVRGKLIGKFPGGIIGNFCCAAAKFGARSGIVTTIGDDEFGRISLDGYREFGVDTGGVVVKPGQSTYFCVVYLDPSGEKALTIAETPLLVPKVTDIDMSYIRRGRFLHLSSLDLEIAQYVTHELQDSPVKVSIDVEATAAGSGISEWEDVLTNTSIVFINEFAIRALFGNEDNACSARYLLALGPTLVIVTAGAKGAEVFTQDGVLAIPAFQVPVKDTTGAGDCFNAVFLTGLARGWDLKPTARHAAAAAALSIQSVGARTGLPTLQDVQSFLSDRSH